MEDYIAKAYGVLPEVLFPRDPGVAVFRHEENRKWFAIIMPIPRSRLGLPDERIIDVVNVKCEPDMIGALRREKGLFPAYHMNKEHWLSIALDGSVKAKTVKMLLDMSFGLTLSKIK